jgi:quercetin dioxygenase-like cupin family protein
MKAIIYKPFSFEKQTFQCISYSESEFIMLWTLEPNGRVDPHFHKHSHEHFKITKGVAQFSVNGEKIIKKEGEELLVKKGIIHSIRNNSKEQIEVIVTYTPCADIHRMFIIMATLEQSNPGSSVNIAKYVYLAPRLGLKEFSTPQPEFVYKSLSVLVSVAGFFFGWKNLKEKFI